MFSKYFLYFFLLVSIAVGCTTPVKEEATTMTADTDSVVVLTPAQLRNAGIATTQITQANTTTLLKMNGKIDVPPQNLVAVSVPMGGYLHSTKLLPGMHVNKGEVIAIIEDQQYIQLQQDYLLNQSKLHFAELDLNRQRELNQSKASSDKTMQLAQAEVAMLRIQIQALAEKLKLINIDPNALSAKNLSKSIAIKSNITGFVSKVNANIGKYINPSEVLFELINPTDIHLNIRVFEKDVARLAIGQKVLAYSNAEPEKKYHCEIILISKDIGADGTTEVHCHFEHYDHELLPGMYMNAEVAIAASKGYTLPDESIVNFEGKDYVFIQTGERKYAINPVKVGSTLDGLTEILKPFPLMDKSIVTKGAYTLLMALKNKEE